MWVIVKKQPGASGELLGYCNRDGSTGAHAVVLVDVQCSKLAMRKPYMTPTCRGFPLPPRMCTNLSPSGSLHLEGGTW